MELFEKILDCVVFFVGWMLIWIIAICCWTGAEVMIEGVVHIGKVDCYVIGVLSFYITRWIGHLEKKIVGNREVEHGE